MGQETKTYELAYFIGTDTIEATETVVNEIRKYLENSGALVQDISRFDKRRLGYPIGKAMEAYFGFLKFFVKTNDNQELITYLSGQKDILRSQITIAYAAEEPSRRRENRPDKKPIIEPVADTAAIDKKLEEILGK